MKPTIVLASTTTPDGQPLALRQHDRNFLITLGNNELMTSREHESELELARLGCARIAARRCPTVLIGGLGMGYTLREALDMLQPGASVVVSELLPEVVRWNREFIGELAGHPLRDKRVVVKIGDVADLAASSERAFDAIMLDLDNGPAALTDEANYRIYNAEGIHACMRALHDRGCLSIWSAAPDVRFERRLSRAGLHFRLFRAPAHKGGKARSRCIWVASKDPRSLPDEPPRPARQRAGDRA